MTTEHIISLILWIVFVSLILLICGVIENFILRDLRKKESEEINKQFKSQMKILNTDPSEYYDVIDFDVERRKK